MTPASNLKFDYLVASQAQKHLTVNNAFARIDACSQWVVQGDASTSTNLEDGKIYLGDDGVTLEIYLNGGFEPLTPKLGWQAYFLESGTEMRFDGQAWVSKRDHYQTSIFTVGQSSTVIIPEKSVVFGLTARVIADLSGGGATSWRMGVPGDDTRYGQGLWLGKNGWAKGLTGTPLTYWQDTPVQIKGEGGDLSEGEVEIRLYLLELEVPPEV